MFDAVDLALLKPLCSLPAVSGQDENNTTLPFDITSFDQIRKRPSVLGRVVGFPFLDKSLLTCLYERHIATSAIKQCKDTVTWRYSRRNSSSPNNFSRSLWLLQCFNMPM